MYGTTNSANAAAEVERTAFRKAEKRYKLYKTPSLKSRAKQWQQTPATDLSEVVDFAAVLESYLCCEELPLGIYKFDCPGFPHPVFCFQERPGFYFIPGALSIEEQCHWVRESLKSFPQPPNRTNHNAIYGPLRDLFLAAQSEKVLIEIESSTEVSELDKDSRVSNSQTDRYRFSEIIPDYGGRYRYTPASELLRKLRWSTIGLQFDWSKRNYDINFPHNKIPDALCFLAREMAVPAMPSGEEYRPEAAIVNYFGPSDMLGGHLDDMEADWSKPIVSISLGCRAIFLLGGNSRDDLPVAMFLRTGDIVLMAGQARECFHGVPRIFTDDENADVSPLLEKLSSEGDFACKKYMESSRININIRQVY